MTIIGKDRTGLVESVARLVADHGGNWLESRMCRLGGEFAGILRVSVPAERQAALESALRGLEAKGLTVVPRPDRPDWGGPRPRTVALHLIGHDRPGIVREVSSALAGQRVNVEELATECVSAPMTGETLFEAHASLSIPEGCDLDALRRALEQIAADLVVDVSLSEVPLTRERHGAPLPEFE